MTQLTQHVIDAVEAIKDEFSKHNISSLHLQIEVSGPIEHDDLKLTYKVSKYGYGDHVESHDLWAAVEEFLRRYGWQQYNAPLSLSAPRDAA